MTENYSLITENYTLPADYLNNRDPLYIVVPLSVIYTIIFFTGLIGNISTCVVIARNKHMHTATNYYLFSLAASDILLLLSGLPAETFMLWSKHTFIFGESFCILKGFVAETSANATVLTITGFTVERYVAICHPFRSRSLSKLSRAVRLVVLIWIAAMALALPLAIQFGVIHERYLYLDVSHCDIKSVLFEKAFILSSFLMFVIPMTVITVLYILIGLKLRLSGRMTGKRPSVNSDREASRSRTSANQRHVINMLVAVVVTFFICWAPFHAQRLFAMYLKSLQSPTVHPTLIVVYDSLLHVSGILYYLSTTVNPLLYNLMSRKFRLAFKSTLTRSCSRHNFNYEKRSPYGTAHHSSLRTPNGSTAGSTKRQRRGTALVLLTTKNSHFTRANSQPTLTSFMESRKHSESSEGNNNSSSKRRIRETTLVCEKPGQCSAKLDLSCEEVRSKRDLTFSCITKKIRCFPGKKLFCTSKADSNGPADGKEPLEKVLSSEGKSISNSSLLDLDLSEFTGSELAEIMGQLKEEPQVQRISE